MSKYSALAIPGGPVNCVDDVVDILDAVSHDLLFDCNEKYMMHLHYMLRLKIIL